MARNKSKAKQPNFCCPLRKAKTINPAPFLGYNMHYFHVIQSKNGTIYIESTNDLRKRINEHNNGKSKSTKRYMLWKIVYYVAYLSEFDARNREKKLKHHGKGLRN